MNSLGRWKQALAGPMAALQVKDRQKFCYSRIQAVPQKSTPRPLHNHIHFHIRTLYTHSLGDGIAPATKKIVSKTPGLSLLFHC